MARWWKAAFVALALAGCGQEPEPGTPGKPESVGDETETPAEIERPDPGLVPPDDPQLPF